MKDLSIISLFYLSLHDFAERPGTALAIPTQLFVPSLAASESSSASSCGNKTIL
jgi:hypothetical protein